MLDGLVQVPHQHRYLPQLPGNRLVLHRLPVGSGGGPRVDARGYFNKLQESPVGRCRVNEGAFDLSVGRLLGDPDAERHQVRYETIVLLGLEN